MVDKVDKVEKDGGQGGSELGGPSGKLFRFVSCVRARGAYVR